MDLQSICKSTLSGVFFSNGSFLGAEPLPGQECADIKMFSALLHFPQYLLSLYLMVFCFCFSEMREETEIGFLLIVFFVFVFFLLFIASDRASFSLSSFKYPPHFFFFFILNTLPLLTLALSEAASSKKWLLPKHSFLADPKI